MKLPNIKIKEKIPSIFRSIVFFSVFILFYCYGVRLSVVNGESMMPYYEDGQILLINQTKKITKDYNRFDVVIFKSTELNMYLIKRIIGVPGDTIQIKQGLVYINDHLLEENKTHELMNTAGLAENKITLKEGEYFMLGDNRNGSMDSRDFGVISDKDIIGTVYFSIIPFKPTN